MTASGVRLIRVNLKHYGKILLGMRQSPLQISEYLLM